MIRGRRPAASALDKELIVIASALYGTSNASASNSKWLWLVHGYTSWIQVKKNSLCPKRGANFSEKTFLALDLHSSENSK